MSKETTSIQVNASFYDPADFTGTVYFNETSYTFTNSNWIPTPAFGVTGAKYKILNIAISAIDYGANEGNSRHQQ